MNEKKENALVPRPSGSVEKAVPGVKRILSGMVSDTLALASREQRTLAPTRYRIGNYEWCEPDYRQILIWAEETGLKPEEVLARFDQQAAREWEERHWSDFWHFSEPLFEDGRLLKVNLDLRLFHYSKLVWVNGLEITHLRFFGASQATRLHDLGQMPLPRLGHLTCIQLDLTYLSLTGVPQLEYLDCPLNRLEELQLHSVPRLASLDCSFNELTELKFDQTPNLHFLSCVDNRLTQLDLSGLDRLEDVWCEGNKLKDLQLVGLPNLSFLDCSGNQISKLDLSSCPQLEEVNCSKNPIRVLDIRGLKNLRVLNRSPHTKVLMDPEQESKVQDLEAQFQMGISFYYGKDVHQNYAEAAKFFRYAAEERHSSAQAYLGWCCYRGLGMPQDYTEAVKWFRKAADQGNARGQYPLGVCYRVGHGVPKDHAEAVKWFRKAAEQGNAQGQNNLGISYSYGKGIPKDPIEAYKWFKLAAEQGHKDAAKELASLTSTLSPGEQQEGDRRYREFKSSH